MAVHELERGRLTGKIAVGGLRAHQVFQPTANVVAVRAVEMRVAGGEEGQQGQAGHGAIGPASGVLAIAAQHVGLLAGAVRSRIPTAIGVLIIGEPPKRGLHGGLGCCGAAAALRDAGPIRSHAKPIGVGHGLPPSSRGMPVSETSGEPEPPSPPPGRFSPEPTSGELDPVPSPAALPPLVEPVPLLEPSKLIAMRGAGFIRIAAVAVRSNAPGSSLGSLSVMAGNGANCSSSDCGVSSDDTRTGRPGLSLARRSVSAAAFGIAGGAASRRCGGGGASIDAAGLAGDGSRAASTAAGLGVKGFASANAIRSSAGSPGSRASSAAHQALGLGQGIALSPLQPRFFRLGRRVVGKDLPRLADCVAGLAMPRRRRPSRPDRRRSRR